MRKQRSIFIVFSRDISPETNSTGYTIAKKQFLHRGTPSTDDKDRRYHWGKKSNLETLKMQPQ